MKMKMMIKMKGVMNVQRPSIGGGLNDVILALVGTVTDDAASDIPGKLFSVELVSTHHADDGTGKEKESVKANTSYEHREEACIKNIILDDGKVTFTCESWIHSKYDNPDKRVFFANKSNIPSTTPLGIKYLREKELETLRGNGVGERKSFERNKGFSSFRDIDLLYVKGVDIPSDHGSLGALPSLVKAILNVASSVPQFETPLIKERDCFSWYQDEEFCRQTLAGLNPYSIQLVKEWPLKSKLDPEVYGTAESAITKDIVEQEIKGVMTVEEAIQQKRLFLLDYHDLLLPYVNTVRELEGTTLYGSRTLMFLTSTGILKPLAIELTRPPNKEKPLWRHVYVPSRDATKAWLWKLAKAHVLAHDSGYHQLVSHWLRTHCVTEPYIIATNHHLSKMHPVHRLLFPHFQYSMKINALARLALINANGVIESSFSLGKYSMQLSSDAYAQQWRFDHKGLPADLISRGMAVQDKNAEHGIKLTIEDYPFANNGLLLWDAIEKWATTYVNHYYPHPDLVESDTELQVWWKEIRTVGHEDKKDEPWWPQLKTQQDLIGVVSTIMWVSSGHHLAVNFGQYDFAGYFPNRPTIARTKMPDEDETPEEWQAFISKPEDVLLNCFLTKIQANMEDAWKEEPSIKAAFEEFSGLLKKLEDIIDSRNLDPELRNRSGVAGGDGAV